MPNPIIGFIGFGEAAFHIGSGLTAEGISPIYAFDVLADDSVYGPMIRERAKSASVTLVPTLQELMERSRVIFCATSAKYAVKIAAEAAAFLTRDHIYCDLNSASPKLKQEIAALVGGKGGLFVDAAVMDSVPPHKHQVPISASGNGAQVFANLMTPYGMTITYLNDTPGSASAMKMVRSIYMKGFSALLLETLSAAHKSGISQEILESIGNTLSSRSLEELANLLLTRTAIHAERRVTEMQEVMSTLHEMGLDATVSAATATKLQLLVDMDLKGYFNGQAPARYEQVIEAMNKETNG